LNYRIIFNFPFLSPFLYFVIFVIFIVAVYLPFKAYGRSILQKITREEIIRMKEMFEL